MIREVRVHPAVHQKAHDLYREERSAGGSPSEYDVTSGPLAAAAFAFRDFDSLPFDVVEAVRTYTIVDPVFGPVVFVGVLLRGDVVEIVDFSDDPDYWSSIEDDPS